MADGNDLKRVWARMESDEGPVYLSETDLLKVMQPHMTRTSEAAFGLLRQEIPTIAREAVKAFIAEQEEAERKVLEKHGVNKVHPLKAFIARNWAWTTVLIVTVAVLRPDLRGAVLGFVF